MTELTSFPFQVSTADGQFAIAAFLESDELYPRYHELFAKHGYEGNGYCWEGHIFQILEKLEPSILPHLEFDSEAGAFFAYADSEAVQKKFVVVLAPIFSDFEKLEKYVIEADRDMIDD